MEASVSKAVKQEVQDRLMHHMMSTFYELADMNADEGLVEEARRQVRRVEKLFGYEPGSWRS